ncbi:unnamed protein product [Boreogadus saida]
MDGPYLSEEGKPGKTDAAANTREELLALSAGSFADRLRDYNEPTQSTCTREGSLHAPRSSSSLFYLSRRSRSPVKTRASTSACLALLPPFSLNVNDLLSNAELVIVRTAGVVSSPG